VSAVWCGENEVSRRRFGGRAAKLQVRSRDAGKCTGEERRVDHQCSSSLMQVRSNRLFDPSLRTAKDVFSAEYTTKYPINPTEAHAAVLVPFCNLDGNLGLLLKVRGRLMAHSRKVRWAPSRFTLVNFHLCWSSFSGGKVNPTDESVLHAALREVKKEAGIRRQM